MGEERVNRTAEIAAELLGARVAADFLREAWSAASPEAKQGIADALLKKVVASISDGNNWEVNRIIDQVVTVVVKPKVEVELAKRKDIENDIAARIASRWPHAVDGVVKTAIDEALRQVRESFERRTYRP